MSIFVKPSLVVNPKWSSPYIPSIVSPTMTSTMILPNNTTLLSPGFLSPMVTPKLPSHLDVNQNPNVRFKVSNHYYYTVLDKWLWDDNMNDILNFLKVTGDKVDVLSSMKEYNENNIKKDTQKTTEQKVKFIEKNILSVDNVYKLLKEFAAETGIDWVDMSEQVKFVRDKIKHYLRKKLTKLIEKKL
jgi:hypothetical protein